MFNALLFGILVVSTRWYKSALRSEFVAVLIEQERSRQKCYAYKSKHRCCPRYSEAVIPVSRSASVLIMACAILTYMSVANNGNTAPAMDRTKVFTAIAELA